MSRFLPLPLAALLVLGGCASTPLDPAPAATQPPASPTAVVYDGETLANLLIAEVAAQRQALPVTHSYYQQEALRTSDPGVLEQAAQLAYYLQDYPGTLTLTGPWLDRHPNNESALRLAILAHIQLGQIDQATPALDALIGHHGQQGLARLVGQGHDLSAEDNLGLIAALAPLTERYPDQAPLWYARALHQQHQGNAQQALAANRRALRLLPEHRDAQILQGLLLEENGHSWRARRHFEKLIKAHPEQRRPRISYTRMLLAKGDLARAETQLQALAEQFPDDLDLQFSLALLSLEAGANDSARQVLQALLARGHRRNEIHFYLGRAAEEEGNLSQAVEHYLQVQGQQQIRAQVQAARLFYQQGKSSEGRALMHTLHAQHPDLRDNLLLAEADMRSTHSDTQGAIQLLSQALEQDPDNVTLLYSRALAAERIDNLSLMETDLRRILLIQPEDPSALNALGYTLADRGLNLHQAFDYIQRALAQRPDDPAILDSMGWVLFRMGKAEQALPYLQKAHDAFPDPEVAAHLGEVLWALGEHRQARQLLRDSLKENPDSRHLRDTMERLGVTE